MVRYSVFGFLVSILMGCQSTPAFAQRVSANKLLQEIAKDGCKIDVEEMYILAEDLGVKNLWSMFIYDLWLQANNKATLGDDESITLSPQVCDEALRFDTNLSADQLKDDPWTSVSRDRSEVLIRWVFGLSGCEFSDFHSFAIFLNATLLFEVGLLPVIDDAAYDRLQTFSYDRFTEMQKTGKIYHNERGETLLKGCVSLLSD